MESIWQKGATTVNFKPLEGKRSTDVLIIGGGIAGILCAYKLKNAGVDCILAEAAEICGGNTKNTTAKITLQHGAVFDKMVNRFGEDKSRLYIETQISAGKQYEQLCRDVDCDYEMQDSYVYSLNNRQKMERETKALNCLGVNAEFLDITHLPFEVAGAVRVKDQAQFHPLKFMHTIAKELPIFEHTKIVNLLPRKAITNGGSITFKKLIVATHFPMLNKHGAYFIKLYQHRSYVLALKGAKNVGGMYVDESDTGLSFRSYGELLLLGGGGHRTGKQGGCWQELEGFAKKYYPQSQIVGRWAAQDCVPLDDIPYIGLYSASTPDIYVATGFNKWGMTNAMVAADILCDLIQNKPNKYAQVFSPSRGVLHPQLAVNAFESVAGLLAPTAPRCPHLGCALKYNQAEHTWDCPCHGSRFTKNGQLIDNPATDDIKNLNE